MKSITINNSNAKIEVNIAQNLSVSSDKSQINRLSQLNSDKSLFNKN